MVRPLYSRLACAFLTALLLLTGQAATLNPALARESQGAHQANTLGIVSVQINPDGSGLTVEADRVFTGTETRNLSVMRLPYPYRLLVEIPYARLATEQTTFPVNRQGIDRVELTENRSPFYSSVRAIVYVTNAQTLSRLTTAFEGTALRIDGLPTVAMTPEQIAEVAAAKLKAQAVPAKALLSKPVLQKTVATPLPPVTKPLSQIAPAPVPPVSTLTTRLTPPPASSVSTSKAQPVQTVLAMPVLPGTQIIEDISYRDGRLLLKGAAQSVLRVKNRFVLTDPHRLVLDIENAVLGNRALLAPINGGSNDVRQIRVGQFDEKTVRIVLEGDSPEQFEAIYEGSDRSLLAIMPYAATSITKLSANTRVGQVESIDLKRENGSTILRLEASTPIVHRLLKRDNRVVVDLLNEAAHPSAIGFNPEQYPEITKMRLEPLTEGQPNSKLSITLAHPSVRVTPMVSEDGKVIELMLTAGDASALIANVFGPAGKAPFPARIVVDAGHGGKDRGANRNGVDEKDLNLSLALMLRDQLTAQGFKVYMTRTTDEFLPLPRITAITNQIKPDLFISIHHNASVNPAIKGIETYWYTPQSLPLARKVHAREINAVGVRDGGVKRNMFYVIHHTDVPAILCEVGYVSNPDELADLQTMERKQKTVRAISDGVVDYLKTRMSAKAR